MWIPKSEEEIITAAHSGALEEGPTFDAKKELPGKGKNYELAKDVAAMATDGGVLLYGVDEDQHGEPTVLNPIPLVGQAERIQSIVLTSITEPPFIRISTISTSGDPSKGYIVVVVPLSERAPHMVIVKDEYRYYGRAGKLNRPLNEADVARLYERRGRTEVDRNALLETGIQHWSYPRHSALAYLYLFARPTLGTADLLHRAAGIGETPQSVLSELILATKHKDIFPTDLFEPDFYVTSRWQLREEGLRSYMGYSSGTDASNKDDLASTLDLQVNFDGTSYLFAGRVGDQLNSDGRLVFFPPTAAGLTTRFLALLGLLYDKARYFGSVDVGVAIVGIQGRVSYSGNNVILRHVTSPYDRDEYRRTTRSSALELKDGPRGVAKALLMPLFDAMSQGRVDPFNMP
jgi:hypothetical protein